MLVQHASEGNRNETLNKAAFNLGRLTQPGMLSWGRLRTPCSMRPCRLDSPWGSHERPSYLA